MRQNGKIKILYKRILLSFTVLAIVMLIFTIATNRAVISETENRIYRSVDSAPRNKVGLLLGTNPINRIGKPNTYFTNRIKIAAELYHAGKVDYILASGDNHRKEYDEATAMRDSLMAHGVPENRIILDFAGFRTLDSVVRAKEVFGCDSLTIISQADHCARALYLAEATGINAIAVATPLLAGRWVRTRLTLREWLARDKMMLDLWFGKRPHFLGEKIAIPELPKQKSYSTNNELEMTIIGLDKLKVPVDSIVVKMSNHSDQEATFGEWYRIERLENGNWTSIPFNDDLMKILRENDNVAVMFFHDIGYGIGPHSTREYINHTSAYNEIITPGKYRLSKTFHYPPTPVIKADTAYVEFEIR